MTICYIRANHPEMYIKFFGEIPAWFTSQLTTSSARRACASAPRTLLTTSHMCTCPCMAIRISEGDTVTLNYAPHVSLKNLPATPLCENLYRFAHVYSNPLSRTRTLIILENIHEPRPSALSHGTFYSSYITLIRQT